MAEAGGRPILPQTAHSQSFGFAQPTLAPRENQRNYVFVDEHNRHKRLKVMRACEGCRRRKIKCDAATTNSWPCAACVRLKLTCVPPQVSYEKDFAPGSNTFELESPDEYGGDVISPQDDFQGHQLMPQHLGGNGMPALSQPGQVSYADGPRMYPTAPYLQTPGSQNGLSFVQMPAQMSAQDLSPAGHQTYATSQAAALGSPDSDGVWRGDMSASSLAEAMGDLKIDQNAVAPYIANQKKTLAEAPALEEYEIHIPQQSSADLTVRIPLEMMPSEHEALSYFDYFFINIHPYIPVINRSYFYQQWHTNRNSISPLLLEAIFACAALNMSEMHQGNKWLALASKHEESFRDVPRLSTMQAMLLILKARESMPKRGYYYRSWMTLVNLAAMGKDLELNDHYEQHELGESCGSTAHDCVTKTRVWHTLWVLEIMVGGPQGRSEFAVRNDTIDMNVPQSLPGLDEGEQQVSRQFALFMRVARNIRRDNELHRKLRRRPGWGIDPELVDHNQNFTSFMAGLPRDHQIRYPDDGSPPWIPSHLVANLHVFHHLGVIMHHRPQLQHYIENNDPAWRNQMLICYASAKSMCKLQEAILQNYGLPGMLSMLRGVSFTIYTILTCTMLHLVAITSPDQDISADGRDFFARHMRILEQVTPMFPMPEIQDQVNNLREAFSADTRKPFELKPSFPYGSPSSQHNSSPISTTSGAFRGRGSLPGSSLEQPGQITYHGHPMTPPTSATDMDPKADAPLGQSLGMMGSDPRHAHAGVHTQDQGQWNPARIFEYVDSVQPELFQITPWTQTNASSLLPSQWNAAFGTPPSAASQESSPPLRQAATGNGFEARSPHDGSQASFVSQSGFSPPAAQVPGLQSVTLPQAGLSYPSPVGTAGVSMPGVPSYVTPSMWQDAVASSFENGIKRRYNDYAHDVGHHG